jgi:pimeloyl-ACP methyl ester carboxylesterase
MLSFMIGPLHCTPRVRGVGPARAGRSARSLPAALALLMSLLPAAAGAQTATHRLLVFLNGTSIGTEDSTLRRSAEGWTINGTGRLSPPIDLTTRQLVIRYDSDWKPIALTVDGTLKGSALKVTTTFSGTAATSSVTQFGQSSDKKDLVSSDTIVLPNLFFASYEALAMRLSSLTTPDAALRVYVAPQMEIAVSVKALDPQTIETPRTAISARRFALTFQNPGGALPAEIWIDSSGRLLRFDVPAQGLAVVREDISSVSARRQNITRAGDEPIRIPANGFTLVGTVSKPAGAPDAKGRYPAIVLVAGSGPVDRDETVAGIPIFGQLAGALADAGYLVVRYDKRGVGQSGGRAETATLYDYADDLLAVVRALKERKDVDDERIVLVGHSEGGWISLIAADREDDIRALVLIGTPSGSGADLVLEQQTYLLEQSELSPEERQKRVDLQKRVQAAVLGKGDWSGVPEALRKQADIPWFRSLLAFSPDELIGKLRHPILVIQGELDRQVAAHHADRLGELARARKKVPETATKVVKLPGINHLLVPAKTGNPSEYPMLEQKEITPAVGQAIVEWLKALPKD